VDAVEDRVDASCGRAQRDSVPGITAARESTREWCVPAAQHDCVMACGSKVEGKLGADLPRSSDEVSHSCSFL
jgi:hypothetical protein